MMQSLSLTDFRQLNGIPVVDVRTPQEFAQGHIPGAINLPIFSNEERVQVGTTYKQQGREPAILLGFDLTGPKWSGFIKEALTIAPDKKIAVHCWRGGMRSGAMAWALDLFGFDVFLLQGGYKSWRNWALQQFETTYPLTIIGGLTGSGKTSLLHQLQKDREQIIDLEHHAQHQGSAFGSMNRMTQPTQEQFENDFAFALSNCDLNKRLWIEDESSTIGKRIIPRPFWRQMLTAPLIDVQIPEDVRIQSLLADYGTLDKTFLKTNTERIQKRLGPLLTKQAITAIEEDRLEDFIRAVLVYYDKTYKKGIMSREPHTVRSLNLSGTDRAGDAKQIASKF